MAQFCRQAPLQTNTQLRKKALKDEIFHMVAPDTKLQHKLDQTFLLPSSLVTITKRLFIIPTKVCIIIAFFFTIADVFPDLWVTW